MKIALAILIAVGLGQTSQAGCNPCVCGVDGVIPPECGGSKYNIKELDRSLEQILNFQDLIQSLSSEQSG